ncbi:MULTISPECIES: DUF2089 family protein [Priestia]|jgi:hypothetical protein|uniref:DUF2089 family protein n=1 Tax=Priestia TaxID=2800373 RepID=UPI00094D0B77|nr:MULTISPECIES: DUF2089 family protein [Priestia]MBU3573154.1 DUF2089 family protein [Priestia aryabhattai]MBY0091936.1 DUF2089 family protein [Priestia aryabhattai]MBY0099844.1 DUF2089 family protein [Priestia aryabhattai]MCM3097914.1 DUF2089 domain-containing protein [Priestia megaterium]MCM3153676.1 DUF2089 domain-containing protein [Priestia megaterium]
MDNKDVPSWILSLESDDVEFIRKFVLNSGSLKQLAKDYEVSYPTVRIRLDRLIQKIEINEEHDKEELISLVKKLAIEERISLEDAKLIIEKYKGEKGIK